MDFLLEATFSLANGKQYWIPPNSTEGSEVQWLEVCSITAEQIDTKKAELEAEWDSQEYARNRAKQYPDLADQLDLLFHDMTSGKGDKTGEWYKAVNKVKTDNPKG